MWSRALASWSFALFHLSALTSGQLITVTVHNSACSATYPSTTVVPSTVLVSPTPWTDQAANSGTPFVLRIQQVDSSGWTKRQAEPSWLMYNGNTTTNGSVAEQYHINNGQLLTSNGSYVSTDFQVLNQALAASDYIEPINTTFSVADGMLNWTNPTFSNGTAQFYKLPPGLLDNALILVKFLGPMQPARSWSPIVLYADPVDAAVQGTGLPAPPSSLSTMASPSAGGSPVNSGHSSMVPSVSLSNSPIPTATQAISPNGHCGTQGNGGTPDGFTCTGSQFGTCCSYSGFCGSTPDFCLVGCQTGFGSCIPGGQSISPNGKCGANNGNLTCAGSAFGNCCSTSGNCGSTSEYCAASSCDSMFGTCNPAVSSMASATSSHPIFTMGNPFASSSSATTSPSATVSHSSLVGGPGPVAGASGTTSTTNTVMVPATSSTTGLAAPSPAPPCPSPTCPAIDTTTCNDPNGKAYAINCDTGVTGGTILQPTNLPVNNDKRQFTESSFVSCQDECDMSAGCIAVTYVQSSQQCTMYNSLSGTGPAAGSLFAARDPTQDSAPAAATSSAPVVTNTGGYAASTGPPGVPSYTIHWSSVDVSVSAPNLPSASSNVQIIGTTFGNIPDPSETGRAGTLTPSSQAMMSSSSSAAMGMGMSPSSSANMGMSTSSMVSSAPLLPPLSTGSLDFTNTPVSGGLITEAPTSPAAESTTSAAGNAGSLPVTSSTSTAGDVTGTSASSSAAAATSGAADFNCASVDGTTATDGEGVAYNLRCGDSSAPALNVYWDQANVGYTSCFAACDNFPGCVAFTYAPNAVGLGYCYLKGEPGNPTTGSPSTVFGVKASYVAPSSSAAAPGSPTSETATASTGSTETTGVDTPPSATSATGSASAAATTDAGPQPTFVPTGTLAPIPLPTSPVACNFGDPDDYDEDDSYCEIDLPFQMQMFSMSDTKAFPSSNGFLSLSTGGSQYQTAPLPDADIPPSTACPLFNDLFICRSDCDDGQGIYYEFNDANTTVTYEWVASRSSDTTQQYQFVVFYDSALPGVFTYTYYIVGPGNNGQTASVGIQGVDAANNAVAAQYSFQEAVIAPGLTIRCDTTVTPAVCTS